MTPKEKAKYLINQYRPIVKSWDCYNDEPMPEDEIIKDAKKGALIAVQEIIILLDELPTNEDVIEQFAYFIKLKQEIKKL